MKYTIYTLDVYMDKEVVEEYDNIKYVLKEFDYWYDRYRKYARETDTAQKLWVENELGEVIASAVVATQSAWDYIEKWDEAYGNSPWKVEKKNRQFQKSRWVI